MSGEGLQGAVYVPDDGYLEPNGITRELARRAVARGAELVTGTRVTGIAARRPRPGPGRRDDRGPDPHRARRQRRRPVGAPRGGHGGRRPADRPPDAPVPDHAARPRPGAAPRDPGGPRSREPRLRARGGRRIPDRRLRAPSEGVAARRRPVGVHAAAAPGRVGAVRPAPGGGDPPIPGRREGRDPPAGQRPRRLHAGRPLRARPRPRPAGLLGGGRDVDQRDRRRGRRRAGDGRVDPRGRALDRRVGAERPSLRRPPRATGGYAAEKAREVYRYYYAPPVPVRRGRVGPAAPHEPAPRSARSRRAPSSASARAGSAPTTSCPDDPDAGRVPTSGPGAARATGSTWHASTGRCASAWACST